MTFRVPFQVIFSGVAAVEATSKDAARLAVEQSVEAQGGLYSGVTLVSSSPAVLSWTMDDRGRTQTAPVQPRPKGLRGNVGLHYRTQPDHEGLSTTVFSYQLLDRNGCSVADVLLEKYDLLEKHDSKHVIKGEVSAEPRIRCAQALEPHRAAILQAALRARRKSKPLQL